MAATITAGTRAGVTTGVATPARPRLRRANRRRVGSRQVVTIRGRRIPRELDQRVGGKLALITCLLAVVAIVVALVLSGLSTQTSLQIAKARDQERKLIDQVEVLERDVEYLRSSAEIARRAAEMGMVTPDQPAVLSRDANGTLVELRPGEAETRGIFDVNGAPMRPDKPTSDPAKTDSVPGLSGHIPDHPRRGASGVPYAPGGPDHGAAPAPAPAPAPVPAPAPAPIPAPAPAPIPAPAPAPGDNAPQDPPALPAENPPAPEVN